MAENKNNYENEKKSLENQIAILKNKGSNREKELLDENSIESFVLNQKGSAFLVGEIHLYVDEKDENKAKEIIEGHDI